jgi:hypothetical protein
MHPSPPPPTRNRIHRTLQGGDGNALADPTNESSCLVARSTAQFCWFHSTQTCCPTTLCLLFLVPHAGEAVDRRLLSGLVRMLGDLGLYGTTFSPLLLEETAAFYKEEGQRLIEAADVPHYLAHCEASRWREGGGQERGGGGSSWGPGGEG